MNTGQMTDNFKDAWVCLLQTKETQLRISMLDQGYSAVDRGIHAGGAFSALIPLVALYYGGYISYDAKQPAKEDLDVFILSKGHAIAALASVYADLGYFAASVLENSRSCDSLLNGHPGPILPGVHVSTGPLGQGIGVAQGFAMAGRGKFDVFSLTGDGEMQEGIAWEPVLYAKHAGLENFCVMVDCNNGQLDKSDELIYPSNRTIAKQFKAFGWNVFEADARSTEGVLYALDEFKYGRRNGKPTAVMCLSQKGEGGFSNYFNQHKITLSEDVYVSERSLQKDELKRREGRLSAMYGCLGADEKKLLSDIARGMNIALSEADVRYEPVEAVCVRAPKRDKTIKYEKDSIPSLKKGEQVVCMDVVRECMKVFARDERVVSIDSDLASTSGLMAGIGHVDKRRGINVGIAEANMMNIAEAYAVSGYNVWTSTFCPFFNWQVMRRIAVGQQERMEDIESRSGWLNEGHGLDITFLATASNLDTVTNGATHMGNDDLMVFDTVPGLRIIDVSCPQQLISVMKWIIEGNKGLVYVRIMRAGSAVLYDDDFDFQIGKGRSLTEEGGIALISSGRGVHECLGAYDILRGEGTRVQVIDMPSFDGELSAEMLQQGKKLLFVEQNNGYLARRFYEYAAHNKLPLPPGQVYALNLLDESGRPRFIHSGTYQELAKQYGLDAQSIAVKCAEIG